MRIALGTDHGGFHLKAALLARLRRAGHRVQDVGCFCPDPCDYPPIAAEVARAVRRGSARRGILLCKSGAGMAIVANRFPGVRAAVCSSAASARHAREHNHSNVLVLAAQGMRPAQALEILSAWLKTPAAGGRHARRVRQIRIIERAVNKW